MNHIHPALLAALSLTLGLVGPLPLSQSRAAAQAAPLSSSPAPQNAPPQNTPRGSPTIDPVPHLRRLGCAPGHVLITSSRLFATCAGSGVWTLTHSPDGGLTLIERRLGASEARSLFLRGNEVWVQFASGDVSPLSALLVAAPAAAPAIVGAPGVAPAAALESVEGRVLSVNRTTAVISLGKLDGVSPEDHIEVPVEAEGDAELGGAAERFAVGRVAAVSDHRASVNFGFGEPVVSGSSARKTPRTLTNERLAPDRVGHTLNFEFGVRPYLPVRHAGVGAIGELALTYRASTPVYVRADVTPLGGRIGSGSARGAFGVFGSAGWDHNVFAVGVGAGLLERRDYGRVHLDANGYSVDAYDVYRKTVPSFAVMQYVRVGALDGLHASFTNVLAIAKNSDEWAFGYLMMRAQIPLSSTMWVRPSAGGGRGAGFVVAELGLRALLFGNGRSSSLFVTPSVGVAGIGVQAAGAVSTSFNATDGVIAGSPPPLPTNNDHNYVVGPMIGLHAEYRLGL